MSRIAKAPIIIPVNVEVKLSNQDIFIKGINGELSYTIHKSVLVQYVNNKLIFTPYKDCVNSWAIAGTTRALLNNMIIGVTSGFVKKLELVGVGYRVEVESKFLNLFIGYSHPIKYKLPRNITIECISQTEILIKGADKQVVGQVAADIRSYRRPEHYKGKGVRYANEIIHIKETKKK